MLAVKRETVSVDVNHRYAPGLADEQVRSVPVANDDSNYMKLGRQMTEIHEYLDLLLHGEHRCLLV